MSVALKAKQHSAMSRATKHDLGASLVHSTGVDARVEIGFDSLELQATTGSTKRETRSNLPISGGVRLA